MLFIANNKNLLDPRSTRQLDQYTLLIQAVGNSIRVQADELAHRDENRRRREDDAEDALTSLRGLVSRTPPQVIDDVSAGIEADRLAAAAQKAVAKAEAKKLTESKAAQDAIVESVNATYSDLQETAEQMRAALETSAFKKAAGSIALNDVFNGQGAFADVDKTQIERKIAELPAAADFAAVVGAIKAWATQRRSLAAATGDGATATTVEHLESYLATLLQFPVIATGRDTIVATLKDVVVLNATKAKEANDAKRAASEKADKALSDATAKRKTAQAESDKLAAALAERTAEAKKAGDRENALKAAKNQIGAHQEAFLERLKDSTNLTPPDVYAMLIVFLADKESDDNTSDADKEALRTTVAELRGRTPPLDPIAVDRTDLATGEDVVDVIDRLIRALEFEHVLAVRRSGSDSADALRFKLALSTAAKHRANKIFIRPASAYLRTSYTSTSLQDDPGLTWNNELSVQAGRSFPFVGGAVGPDEQARAKIVAEIDKQFWHNINKVRVAGAGATNYAIAKDATGNWYVKSYSANPEDIINSARNLALFNLGGGVGADLLGSAQAREAGVVDGQPAISDAERTTLGRVFTRHRTNYQDATKEDWTELKALLEAETLKTQVQNSWSQHADTKEEATLGKLTTELSAPAETLKKAAGEMKAQDKPEEQGVEIVSALRAVRRFHLQVKTGIERSLSGDENKQAREAAIGELSRVVSDALLPRVADRKQVLTEYSRAVVFLGDAVRDDSDEKKAAEQAAAAARAGQSPQRPRTQE